MFTQARGARGCLLVGKRRQKLLGLGERRPLFHLCLGSLSQVRCSGRGKWSSSLPPHPPPQPLRVQGWQCWAQGAGMPAQGRVTVGGSPPESREKFGGVAAVVVCSGREVAPGDVGCPAGGPVGGWSRALSGGSVEVGEGLVGSVPPRVGLG